MSRHPPSAAADSGPPAGPWRSVLLLSLLLNAGLALLLARPHHLPPTGHPPTVATTAPPSLPPAQPTAGPDSTETPSVVTNIVPFHWAVLESDDFAVYVANLRGVGCPEELLRDLVAAELRALYASPSPASPPELSFWSSGETLYQVNYANEHDRRAKQQECQQVYRTLMGEPMPPEPLDQEASALLILILDFLPPERRLLLLSLLEEAERTTDLADWEGQHLPPRERIALLEQTYRDWGDQVNRSFSSVEIEEMSLRSGVLQFYIGPEGLKGVRLTGPEMREVFRLLWDGRDPHYSTFAEDHNLPGRADLEDLEKDPGFQLRTVALLGPDRGRQYLRNLDPNFANLGNFSREHKLAESVTQRLYEAQRETAEAAQAVKTDPALDENERTIRLRQLQLALEIVAREQLGTSLADTYRQANGHWWAQHLEVPE